MNHNPWEVLGIAATGDERAIKRAYAKALKALDADDREAFMTLREAYEAALSDASYWGAEEAAYAASPGLAEAAARDGAQGGSPWAAAYDDYTQADGLEDAYADALDALPDAVADDADEGYAASPEERFLDDCWQGWNVCGSDAALLSLLQDEQARIADADLDLALDYSEMLLDWFYRSENDAPLAFAWAAGTYGWQLYARDWRMDALYERYPSLANPQVVGYPALVDWEARWQVGFWARLGQALHPLWRGAAEADFALFRRASYGVEVADLSPGLRALDDLRERVLFGHILSFAPLLAGALLFGSGEMSFWGLLLAWLGYLLGAALYETLKLAGLRFSRREGWMALGVVGGVLAMVAFFSSPPVEAVRWLTLNVGAMLVLYLAAVFWQRMIAQQWFGQFVPRKWWWHGLMGLALLLMWWLGYQSLQHGTRNETVLLALAGAAFAYATLCRTVLPQRLRAQYASALLHGALMLPLFWFVLDTVSFSMESGALPWVLKAYVFTSLIGIAGIAVYRQWHYWTTLLAGLALFVAFMVGLPPLWLLKLQLGLWVLLPLAILATPRWPRLGFLLPEVLRVFGQAVLGIALPLLFWDLGWYLAFAMSIGVALYLLWLDAELDGAMA
ncbi:MAG: J domain-containing protein [Cardiobacteriaceae bacterium]|nr:J domain-containing protein [Cardiobacteriaceae bacterium]